MKVFLSRDKAGLELTDFVRSSGWDLICFSCVEFSLTNADEPPEADWIFFYSPSAVRLYADNFTFRSFRFAALGEGTVDAMRGRGFKPEFIGKSSDTSEVMSEFARVIRTGERVVQARAEKSFERLREVLQAEQILDWPFYQTQAKQEIPEATADYYIFTSPSNAEAYLQAHQLTKGAVVIVFGDSTKKAVEQYTTAKILLTEMPGEEWASKIFESL